MNDLAAIFTKNNILILKLIDHKELHLRDIADELHISPASVHNAVKLFKKHKLIIEIRKKNLLIIKPNHQSKLYQKIIGLIKTFK
ncbi:MAG: helix-turn-helix domain-containing protein [archaeon]